MKKHNTPPEATDEELIQTMETLLDQDLPDQAAIQAILEELDRRSGAAPFDTQAGWADLQTRRQAAAPPRSRRRLHRFPIAIAAVLVCLAVSATALTGHWGLDQNFMAYFGITDETAPLLQGSSVLSDCSVTKNGATITVKQTAADANGVYVLFQLETPDSISLDPETYLRWKDGPWLEITVDGKSINHAGSGGLLEVVDDHHALFLVTAQSSGEAIAPGQLKLELRDLEYASPQAEGTLLEGSWSLKWELTAIQTGKTILLEDPVVWNGHTYPYEKICLTSLSLAVFGTYGTGPVEELPWAGDYPPVALVFQDGTQLPLGADLASNNLYTAGGGFNGENYTLRILAQFKEILDPDQVSGVQIGDQTFYFS